MQSKYQDAMIATISHEQMNPLNSIITMSESLFTKYKQKMEYMEEGQHQKKEESVSDMDSVS